MFTGIVEELGKVESVRSGGNTLQLSIAARKILEDMALGDSISVNGVCLTVTNFSHDSFSVDVMPETFQHTSLSQLSNGANVNLERAMSANGRFGGHFVTGHVDIVGTITKKEAKENAIYIDINYESDLGAVLIDKGSITIDGISLTIFVIKENGVTVSIIPHTAKETVLGKKGIGELVNIEFDLIGKYISKCIGQAHTKKESSSISEDFLKKNGFL